MYALIDAEDWRLLRVLIVFTRRGECRGSSTARSSSRRGSLALPIADIVDCRMSSIRSVSGCFWIASALGQTVPDFGFIGRSEVSCDFEFTSNKPRNPAFLGALQPTGLHDVQCYPCPLTKFARCVLHPSPPPQLPCSATREAQSWPHNSELRTHRQLERQEARITRRTGILCEPLLTISTKLKSFLRLRTFGIGSPSKP